jgi:uncharacterized protein (UPF0333 family)
MKREILAAVLVVLVAASLAAGYVAGVSSHQYTTETITQLSTMVVATSASPSLTATYSSVATATCYGGTIPTNSSSSGAQNYNRTVFNITEEFDSWNWTSLSTFRVGSYTFVTTYLAAGPYTVGNTSFFQLEPQLFINVTNNQGQTQRTSVTNLGGWNGQTWPPGMSLQQTLFGGSVSIQWLFQCNSHNVFLVVTTQ